MANPIGTADFFISPNGTGNGLTVGAPATLSAINAAMADHNFGTDGHFIIECLPGDYGSQSWSPNRDGTAYDAMIVLTCQTGGDGYSNATENVPPSTSVSPVFTNSGSRVVTLTGRSYVWIYGLCGDGQVSWPITSNTLSQLVEMGSASNCIIERCRGYRLGINLVRSIGSTRCTFRENWLERCGYHTTMDVNKDGSQASCTQTTDSADGESGNGFKLGDGTYNRVINNKVFATGHNAIEGKSEKRLIVRDNQITTKWPVGVMQAEGAYRAVDCISKDGVTGRQLHQGNHFYDTGSHEWNCPDRSGDAIEPIMKMVGLHVIFRNNLCQEHSLEYAPSCTADAFVSGTAGLSNNNADSVNVYNNTFYNVHTAGAVYLRTNAPYTYTNSAILNNIFYEGANACGYSIEFSQATDLTEFKIAGNLFMRQTPGDATVRINSVSPAPTTYNFTGALSSVNDTGIWSPYIYNNVSYDPEFTDISSADRLLRDFSLAGGSTLRSKAPEHLTTVSGVTSSDASAVITVADSKFFFDGWGWSDETPDTLRIVPPGGSYSTPREIVQIASINYSTDTITLANTAGISVQSGDLIYLDGNALIGSEQDGAATGVVAYPDSGYVFLDSDSPAELSPAVTANDEGYTSETITIDSSAGGQYGTFALNGTSDNLVFTPLAGGGNATCVYSIDGESTSALVTVYVQSTEGDTILVDDSFDQADTALNGETEPVSTNSWVADANVNITSNEITHTGANQGGWVDSGATGARTVRMVVDFKSDTSNNMHIYCCRDNTAASRPANGYECRIFNGDRVNIQRYASSVATTITPTPWTLTETYGAVPIEMTWDPTSNSGTLKINNVLIGEWSDTVGTPYTYGYVGWQTRAVGTTPSTVDDVYVAEAGGGSTVITIGATTLTGFARGDSGATVPCGGPVAQGSLPVADTLMEAVSTTGSGDTMSVLWAGNGNNCTVAYNGPNDVTISIPNTATLDTGTSGTATFQFTVVGLPSGAAQTGTCTVTFSNTAPEKAGNTYTATCPKGKSVYIIPEAGGSIPVNKVSMDGGYGSAWATDANNDTITYDIDGALTTETVSISGTAPNQVITYTDSGAGTTSDQFDVTITDGDQSGYQFTVNVTVQSPDAVDDTYSVERNSTDNMLYVLANDSDPAGLGLSIQSVTQPANGTVTNWDTYVEYTPTAEFTGTDTFTYTVVDGNSSTDTATVTVYVYSENPIYGETEVTIYASTIAEDAQTQYVLKYDLSRIVTQSFNGPITYTVTTAPANGSVSFDGNIMTYVASNLSNQTMVLAASSDTGDYLEDIEITIKHNLVAQVKSSIIPKTTRGGTL